MSSDSVTGPLAVTIRPATEDELVIIAEMEQQLFSDPWPVSEFEYIVADDRWELLVAQSDNEIIGYAAFVIEDRESRLANIAVAEQYRRKSVAKQLLRHILDVVHERDCRLILLEVRPSNFQARELYGEFGFRDLYRKPNYYRRPVEDALVMVCHMGAD